MFLCVFVVVVFVLFFKAGFRLFFSVSPADLGDVGYSQLPIFRTLRNTEVERWQLIVSFLGQP